jgi:thiol-disulfide isomerase/thioredoxin
MKTGDWTLFFALLLLCGQLMAQDSLITFPETDSLEIADTTHAIIPAKPDSVTEPFIPVDTLDNVAADRSHITADTTIAAEIKIPGFYASGLKGKGFFLSRHISPKVHPLDKTNMLFSFFTTGCIPCRKEIPFLEKLVAELSISKAYLVNVGDSKGQVEKYIDHFQYNLKVLLDPYIVVAKKLQVESTPVMMVISGDGELLYRHDGFLEADTTEIRATLNKYFESKENEF